MHEDDKEWVDKIVMEIPPEHRQEAYDGYNAVFSDVYEKEPVEHHKMNKARHEANTRLRMFRDKAIAYARQQKTRT